MTPSTATTRPQTRRMLWCGSCRGSAALCGLLILLLSLPLCQGDGVLFGEFAGAVILEKDSVDVGIDAAILVLVVVIGDAHLSHPVDAAFSSGGAHVFEIGEGLFVI